MALRDAAVEMTNLQPTLDALGRVDPKVQRAMKKRLREAGTPVTRRAASRIRNRSGATAAGYKVGSRQSGIVITNRTRGATILEFARVPHSTRGATLIKTLNEVYGTHKPGRILWEAWDAEEKSVQADMKKVASEAEAELARVCS